MPIRLKTCQQVFTSDVKASCRWAVNPDLRRVQGQVRRAGKPDGRILLRREGRTPDRPQTRISSHLEDIRHERKTARREILRCFRQAARLCGSPQDGGQNVPAEELGPPNRVTVTRVLPGGEAAAKGVQEGDIIVQYAGHRITSNRAFQLEATKAGTEPRELVLLRDGREITLRVAPGPLKIRMEETPIEPPRKPPPACAEEARGEDQVRIVRFSQNSTSAASKTGPSTHVRR